MTAINVVRQRDRVHVVTDGAGYLGDGTVLSFVTKAFAVPHWPGVVATRGPALATGTIGAYASSIFGSFDAAISGIEAALPRIMIEVGPVLAQAVQTQIDVVLAGWSAARSRPESYYLRTGDQVWDVRHDEATNKNAILPDPFKLTEFPRVAIAPTIRSEVRESSGFAGVDGDEPTEQVLYDLALCIEAQRQQRFDFEGMEIHCVGCFAQLSTVTESGVNQSIMKRWDDDLIGEPINPRPVDWAQWRREHPINGDSTAGMSKLRRDVLARKASKGKFRRAS